MLYNLSFGHLELVKADSKVYTVTKQSQKYVIQAVYKVQAARSEMIENFVGNYDTSGGFTTFTDVVIFRNRSNLNELEANVSFVVTNPATLEHLEDYRQKHIDPVTKTNWIQVGHLFNMLNVTFNKLWSNSWGYWDPETNKFTGMLGDLQSGIAEFGGTPCFYTLDRTEYVDFIPAWTPTSITFVFRYYFEVRAPPLSYVTNIFTLPFNTHVWYSSFVLCGTIFIITYLIVRWEWKNPVFKKKVENTHGALRPDVLEVAVMEIGAITQQGARVTIECAFAILSNKWRVSMKSIETFTKHTKLIIKVASLSDTEPRSSAGRIAYFIALISLMFLYTSYSANIVALLQSTTEAIRTVEDLLNSRISLGALDVVYNHYYFVHSQDPVRKAIYHQKIAPKGQQPRFMSLEEGMSRVRNEFFGFHLEPTIAYKVVADTFKENEKCALKEVAYINLIPPHMVIKQGSPFQKILESGIRRREEQRIYMKKPVCHSKGNNFGSAGIVDCYAAFLIFGIGLGASLLIFLLELAYRKYKAKRNSEKPYSYYD
nr:unnamed protein product [Callosobruchus analis]